LQNPYAVDNANAAPGLPQFGHIYHQTPQMHVPAEYASLYEQQRTTADPLNPASASASTSASTGASTQQQQQGGFPPMNAANLASMYAAYFPYYMNQFPGANPYGNQPPAGYGQYKYPVYPTPAAAPSASGIQGTRQGVPQHQSGSKQSSQPTAPAASMYSAYYGLPMGLGHQPQQDDQDFLKYSQQQPAQQSQKVDMNKPNTQQDQSSQQAASVAYYNQYAMAGYPGYIPTAAGGYPVHPSQQNRQGQGNNQQYAWNQEK
jgi:hypothetical protein